MLCKLKDGPNCISVLFLCREHVAPADIFPTNLVKKVLDLFSQD